MRRFNKILLTVFTISLFHTSLLAQWVQQPLPVNKPITGIKFINSQTGWACTSRGTPADSGYIIATTNSGTNWFVQVAAYGVSFTDIDFIQNTNFVCGYDNISGLSKLYKSSNNGNNWSIITMVPNMFMGDLFCISKDSLWECGGSIGPDVRTTTDGGNTWIVRTNGMSGQTDKIFFLNYTTGYCGAGFNLYKTTNAGLNWTINSNFSQIITSLFYLNINMGWIGVSSADKIYFTSNSGSNWQTQNLPPLAGTTTDIYFSNLNTGWAGNRSNYIFKTINGGINWGYQRDTSASFRISFIDTITGWSGDFGISHTTNGGGPITYTGFINNSTEIPVKFKLYQNYPNPFNPATTIKLDLPKAASINLVICDILGRELYHISDEYLKAGSYNFIWDASKYSSGVYFYRLIANGFTGTKKMLLTK